MNTCCSDIDESPYSELQSSNRPVPPDGEHLHPLHRRGIAGAIYPDTERGLWALKCSVAILAAGALLQFAVVMFSGRRRGPGRDDS